MKKINLKNIKRGEKGISVIALIVAILLLGSIGYILSSLMSRSQESVPRTLDSSSAFHIAQGGSNFVGKYLAGQSNWGALSNPPASGTLGTGTFTIQWGTYSSGPPKQITVTIIGSSGNAQKQITAVYQQSGSSSGVNSQGGINFYNSSSFDCGSSPPPCIQTNIPPAQMPVIPAPSPHPAAPALGCAIGGSGTRTMPGGTYYCSNLTISQSVLISVTGPVTIFCGNFSMGNSSRFNTSGSAANLLIIASGSVNFNNSSQFKGAIYAPGQAINIGNSAQFTGTIAGGSPTTPINFSNSSSFDNSAGNLSPYYNQTGGSGSLSTTLADWQD